MSKHRRTVTLDPEVDEFLDTAEVNASALVNKLVKNHHSAAGDQQAMLSLRAQQLRSDIEELESRLETKQDELERVEARLDAVEDDRDAILRDAAETIPRAVRTPDNPAVQSWAEKADLTPEAFLDRLDDFDELGGT